MMKHSATIALVTGAGHGIGRAIAARLGRDGAALGIIDLDAAAGARTVADQQAEGIRAHFVAADITQYDQVDAAVAEIVRALGPITLLVNNAAFTEAGNLATITLAQWDKEIEVNLSGTYHMIRAVVPILQARGGGAIVNISSVNGMRYFGNPSYSAAKAGLLNLTQSVASEYGKFNIRCNAISPGSVKTDNITWTIRQQKDPDIFKKLSKWYPLGRVAEPDDIAKAVSFLGSDDAAYITGANLPVDGGLTAGMSVMIDEFVLESPKE
jgi:NAD(P)-dependent dehydrogenase (short-subunit alcohol dehydrogenase family)